MGFTMYDNSSYTIFEGLNTTSYVYNPLTNGSITKGLSALGGHAVPPRWAISTTELLRPVLPAEVISLYKIHGVLRGAIMDISYCLILYYETAGGG
jgi:hypothetical protein